MTVYVLTAKLEGEWRPVGVVDHPDTAEQFADASPDHDQFPFDIGDLSVTGLSGAKFEPHPRPIESIIDSANELEQANKQLIKIIERLATKYNDKQVLQAISGLKAEGKISSVKTADWMDDHLWNLEKRNHTPNCAHCSDQHAKCTCLVEKLPRSVQYPDGHLGCKMCTGDEYDGHYEDCPRMQQRSLFASKLLQKSKESK